MSTPRRSKTTCFICGREYCVWFWDSINLEQHPSASEKLKSGEVFTRSCPFCGVRSKEPYPVACYDMSKGVLFQLRTAENPERFFHLEEQMDDGMRLCFVYSIEDLAEKVLALQNGRDDRIVEMCKYWHIIKLAIRLPQFEVVRYYYDVEDGKEVIIGIDRNGCRETEGFPDKDYQLFDKAFGTLLPLDKGRHNIYDTEWADSFIHEHGDLFRQTFNNEKTEI